MEHLLAEQTRIIRFYRWALEEARREAISNYPLTRLALDAPGATHVLPPENFTDQERIAFGSGTVKDWHKAAMLLLGEPMTAEEAAATKKYLYYLALRASTFPGQVVTYCVQNFERASEESILQRATVALEAILNTSGQQMPGIRRMFTNTIGDWNVETTIDIRSQWPRLYYGHRILRGDSPPGVIIPGCSHLGQTHASTDLLSWLGMSNSGTAWLVTFEKDVQPAIDALVIYVTHFMKNAPALLEGLDA